MQITSKNLAISFTLLSLAIAAGGCTRAQKNVEIGKREAASPPIIGSEKEKEKEKASAFGTLDVSKLREYTSSYDNLTYKFEYLTVNVTNKLDVVGNTATIALTDLPADQVGDVTFTILENGAPKVSSITKGITLVKGINNKIELASLQPVGAGTIVPGTTNATINVLLPGTQPPVSPVPGATATPVPVVIATPTPTSWDGLADRGNEKWKIETVTQ